MSTETDLINEALCRDVKRYREAEQGDKQRIMGRMIDTVMQADGCTRAEAVDKIVKLMQEGS